MERKPVTAREIQDGTVFWFEGMKYRCTDRSYQKIYGLEYGKGHGSGKFVKLGLDEPVEIEPMKNITDMKTKHITDIPRGIIRRLRFSIIRRPTTPLGVRAVQDVINMGFFEARNYLHLEGGHS